MKTAILRYLMALVAVLMPQLVLAESLVSVEAEQLTDRRIPRFYVDAAWPQIPKGQIFGQVPGLGVDADDNVWLLHRPQSLRFSDVGLDQGTAVCCSAAPHVMQFAPDGRFLQAWGGRQLTRSWPGTVHGLYVAPDGTIWIGGNGDGDHVVLNFKQDGTFLRGLGERGITRGNFDRRALGNPADIAVLPSTGEILVADGYINKRIIGFDAETSAATRIWGAYANSPDGSTRAGAFDQSQASSNADGGANAGARTFGDIVHCVVAGPDGRIYVCDRRNNRIQVFETSAAGETQFVRDILIRPETGGTRTASDIGWSPDGAFMYVSDMMNGRVWILDAKTYVQLGAFGRNGRYPGQFTWLHSLVVDSRGNIYTSEVGTGRRVQKFTFQGVR